MYKKIRAANQSGAMEEVGYIETDPSGRYGRFRETLGKGAMKIVYRAFDEVLGMEVAWNQVKLNDAFHSQQALNSLYSEVHLLKNLNHDSIIQYHTSWIDVTRRTFNFITEMFTSGTLREYRQKYPRVDIRVIKRWAREILKGLVYLHALEPPVIHRDLKCDNIFVNGHLGQVKIGDLGLAATLRQSRRAHSIIGTPEFMAPELYEEEYNELVDVYAFGMCVLEMLTCEYPYSECCNLPQIYKKVTSGKLPEAFYKIEDKEAQRFVKKCLENVSTRLSATDLLLDPFMKPDERAVLPLSRVQSNENLIPSVTVVEKRQVLEADPKRTTDMSITGTMNSKDDIVFLKFQISDKDGNARNIHFPFNIVNDTSIDVALEMVKELEITGWEPLEIAEMIEKEISSHVPDWKEHSLSIAHHHQQNFNYKEEGDCEYDGRLHHALEISEMEKGKSSHVPDLEEHSLSKSHHHQQSFNYKDEDDERLPYQLEINEMKEREISSHVPDWKEHSLSKAHHHQQSFNYKEEDGHEDDERLHHSLEINEIIEKEISSHSPVWKEHSLSKATHNQQSYNYKDGDDSEDDDTLQYQLEVTGMKEKEMSSHSLSKAHHHQESSNYKNKEMCPDDPDWKEHSLSKTHHHQQSFNYYEDDSEDDERLHHPFYYTNSSCSSSQDSLPASYDVQSRSESNPAINRSYLQEFPVPSYGADYDEPPISVKYSKVKNCPGIENDSNGRAGECRGLGKSLTKIVKIDETMEFVATNSRDGRRWPRLPRMRSLADMRTQVFHRSMMELINKRRTLKTAESLQNVNEVHDKSVIYGKSKSRWSCRRI